MPVPRGTTATSCPRPQRLLDRPSRFEPKGKTCPLIFTRLCRLNGVPTGRVLFQEPGLLIAEIQTDFRGRTGRIKPFPAPAVSDRNTLTKATKVRWLLGNPSRIALKSMPRFCGF